MIVADLRKLYRIHIILIFHRFDIIVFIICVAKGMNNKEIADYLYLSVYTVTTHRRNISNKLQIHTAAGLIIYAIANKLVNIEEIQK